MGREEGRGREERITHVRNGFSVLTASIATPNNPAHLINVKHDAGKSLGLLHGPHTTTGIREVLLYDYRHRLTNLHTHIIIIACCFHVQCTVTQ